MSTAGNVNEGTSSGTKLQPGQSIKPRVHQNLAIKLVKEYFGYDVINIKELNSYDDVNYLVKVTNPKENGHRKFIFKVLNSMDSVNTGHIEAQHEVMTILNSNGVNCPQHQRTVKGKIFAHVTIPASSMDPNNPESDASPSKIHLIRLLSYVDGDVFAQVKLSESLLYQAGSYIAQVEQYLKGFHHESLENHTSIWFLSSTPELRKFLYVLDDQPERQELVLSILRGFEDRVIPVYPKLEKGLLHGDFNEQNILCIPSSTQPNEFLVHGIIDFGDINIGYYVFELAITMCYMMLECIKEENRLDPLTGSAHVLAGYSKIRSITETEMDILRTCIVSRLCTSLVMGAYTYSQDPGNTYLLTTAKTGWPLLKNLWNQVSDEEIKQIWTSVSDSYAEG